MTKPPFKLYLAPAILVALSLLPIFELRQTFWAVLGLPFAYTTGYPFPYTDKPWFVSYAGGVVIGVFWAVLLFAVSYGVFLKNHARSKTGPVD